MNRYVVKRCKYRGETWGVIDSQAQVVKESMWPGNKVSVGPTYPSKWLAQKQCDKLNKKVKP